VAVDGADGSCHPGPSIFLVALATAFASAIATSATAFASA